MHLAIHRAHQWDLFVTMANLVLSNATNLASEVGIQVASPDHGLEIANRSQGNVA